MNKQILALILFYFISCNPTTDSKKSIIPEDHRPGVETDYKIINVETVNEDGVYGIGDTILIDVTFNTQVNVITSTSAPYLTLNLDPANKNATYLSQPTASQERFSYLIEENDQSTELDYTSINALVAEENSVVSLSQKVVLLDLPAVGAAGSIGSNKNIIIDGIRLSFSNIELESTNSIIVNFSEAIDNEATQNSNYVISGNGIGTLNSNPTSVTALSDSQYRLAWSSGEMLINGDITITVSNVNDNAGNLIGSTNQATQSASGIGESPSLMALNVNSATTVDVTFSEAINSEVTNNLNYALSGTGKGSFSTNPDTVTLLTGNQYRLTWNSGEMKNGGNITITVTNVEDLAGNPIGTNNVLTDSAAGIGNNPSMSISFPTDNYPNVLNRVSWAKKFQGACETGITVNISSSIDTVTPTTTNCTAGNFETWVYTNSISNQQSFDVIFTQTDPAGNSTSVSKTLYKISSACDLSASRSQLTAPWAGGAGTVTDPYLLCTANQLHSIKSSLASNYKLMNDIDLGNGTDSNGDLTIDGSDTDYSAGSGWGPIAPDTVVGGGFNGTSFSGTFDGNEFSITRLTISRSGENYIGLFGQVSTAGVLRHINLENLNVSGGANTGSVVGNLQGKVFSIYVQGSVAGNSGDNLGGLSGALAGRIENSKSAVNVSVNAGTVNNAGGLVGINWEGIIVNSFATGNVSGATSSAGGLIGSVSANTKVVSSLALGAPTAGSNAGGLIGTTAGATQTNNFWAYDASAPTYGTKIATSAGSGAGLATAQTQTQLQTTTTFTNVNWDQGDWEISSGAYPQLRVEQCHSTTPYSSGEGTSTNPFIISNASELDTVRCYLDRFFELNSNFDLISFSNWQPIAQDLDPDQTNFQGTYFTGTLDGAGFNIFNLTINRGSIHHQGLFGGISTNGNVSNFILVDTSIVGKINVGSVTALMNGGLITQI